MQDAGSRMQGTGGRMQGASRFHDLNHSSLITHHSSFWLMKRRRRLLWSTILVLVVGLPAGWWFYLPPTVGGGEPDNWRARLLKWQCYRSVPVTEQQLFEPLTADNANGWYHIFPEPVETVPAYQLRRPPRPSATRRTLVLQPLGSPSELLPELQQFCAAYFQLPVRCRPPLPLPAGSGWSRTGMTPGHPAQYDAGRLLDHFLIPRCPPDAMAYAGVTRADLYNGQMSFVFGQATLYARTGIYSLSRFYPEFWGEPRHPGDRVMLLRRACQVLSHETGHMFGLGHCVLYRCNMNGSNSMADSDRTPLELCPVCREKLHWNIGFDPARRYRDLLRFYRSHGMDPEAQFITRLLKVR